jgi:hypothetical protein
MTTNDHTTETRTLATTFQRAVGRGRVDQVGFLVEDLEASMNRWSSLYRDEEWRVYTYSREDVPNIRYHGQQGNFSMRLALVGSEPQLELIQPLQGPSIYHDWIEAHGYGLHHFGFFVPSVANAIAEMESGGHPCIQSGSGYGLDGDGGFAYYDFEPEFGVHLETIEVPSRRRPSEL